MQTKCMPNNSIQVIKQLNPNTIKTTGILGIHLLFSFEIGQKIEYDTTVDTFIASKNEDDVQRKIKQENIQRKNSVS